MNAPINAASSSVQAGLRATDMSNKRAAGLNMRNSCEVYAHVSRHGRLTRGRVTLVNVGEEGAKIIHARRRRQA